MLLLGSAFLLMVGIVLLMLALALFTLQIWLKTIINLCEGQFIRGGLRLCLGILLVNLFFGSGESYTSLYITIMVLAFAADIGKYLLWWQQRRAETAPGDLTLPPHSPELITLHVRVDDDDYGLPGTVAPPVATHRPRSRQHDRRPGHVLRYRPARPR
jgi:hypothetical protein